jgi:hypothetical protein
MSPWAGSLNRKTRASSGPSGDGPSGKHTHNLKACAPESHYFQKYPTPSFPPTPIETSCDQLLRSFVANQKQTETIFLQSCSRAVTTAEFVHAKTSPRWL